MRPLTGEWQGHEAKAYPCAIHQVKPAMCHRNEVRPAVRSWGGISPVSQTLLHAAHIGTKHLAHNLTLFWKDAGNTFSDRHPCPANIGAWILVRDEKGFPQFRAPFTLSYCASTAAQVVTGHSVLKSSSTAGLPLILNDSASGITTVIPFF